MAYRIKKDGTLVDDTGGKVEIDDIDYGTLAKDAQSAEDYQKQIDSVLPKTIVPTVTDNSTDVNNNQGKQDGIIDSLHDDNVYKTQDYVSNTLDLTKMLNSESHAPTVNAKVYTPTDMETEDHVEEEQKEKEGSNANGNSHYQQILDSIINGSSGGKEDYVAPSFAFTPSGEMPTFNDTYAQQIDDYVKQLANMNYENFTKGASYQDLVTRYGNAGKNAMQDTMGQAMARSGGMSSSWASQVGQQTYSDYMQALEDAAQSQYASERQEVQDNLNNALQLQSNEYDRFSNNYNIWANNQAVQKQDAEDARERILDYLVTYGGSADQLDDNLISKSGYTADQLQQVVDYAKYVKENSGTSASENYKTVYDNALKYSFDKYNQNGAETYLNNQFNDGNVSVTDIIQMRDDLGISTSKQEIYNYIAKAVEMGMSREEAFELLDKYGIDPNEIS